MRKGVIVGLMVFLVLGVVGPAIAQVPEGWNEYVIQPGDTLTELALKQVRGVDRANFLWAAEEIAAVNGIQNPNLIFAWYPIYIPHSIEVLKVAEEKNLVILKLKRAAPPLVFGQEEAQETEIVGEEVELRKRLLEFFTQARRSTAELEGIKNEIARLTKEVRLGLAALIDAQITRLETEVKELRMEMAQIEKERDALLMEKAAIQGALGKVVEKIKHSPVPKEDIPGTILTLGFLLERSQKLNFWCLILFGVALFGLMGVGVLYFRRVGRDWRLIDELSELRKTNAKLTETNTALNRERREAQKRLAIVDEIMPGRSLILGGENYKVVRLEGTLVGRVDGLDIGTGRDGLAAAGLNIILRHECGQEVNYRNVADHNRKCRRKQK